MPSTVLARKYRPRDFETLVGQPHVVQALVNALAQQRLHHAYLFTGTRGVGKTTLARILAKSLNCIGPDGSGGITAHPCNACAPCRDIDAGRFVDYVELDAASNRGVEEITRLLDQAVYKPVVGRFKVYLIDEVHMLSTTAFNAMLKTLEEPPEYLKFILATTDPQKVPATVLSRCLQFNLRPMAPETIIAHLETILAAEGVGADGAALKLIARAARGSMRDAQSLADQAIAHGLGRIESEGVRQMLGAVDRGHAARIVEAVAAEDGAALIGAVDALREQGFAAAGALEEMAGLLQEMAIAQALPDAGHDDDADPDATVARRLARSLPADETQLLYSIAIRGREELALAPDEYSGLVMVLLRMLAFAPREARAPLTRMPSSGDGSRSAGTSAQPEPKRVDRARASPTTDPATTDPATTTHPATTSPAMATGPATATSPATTTSATARPTATPIARPATTVPPAAIVAIATPASAARPAPTAPGELPADRWTALVQRLNGAGTIAAMVRELATQAECVAVVDGESAQTWCLVVERESLRAPALIGRLQAAAAAAQGRPVRLDVEAGTALDSPAARDAAMSARRQAEAERVIHDDPLVRALMAEYKTARIVPGSIKPV